MSRICVKNLPKHATEDRLREFFSRKGEVTDAKLMRTKDGKSRQFAFIGFRSEREAEEALKYFNNSYLDTSRINCEIARKVGDPNIPRPWSRYSAKKQEEMNGEHNETTDGKSLKAPETKGKTKKSKKNTEDVDPQLEEFLQVMQPRAQSKLWANDTVGNLRELNGKSSSKETQLQKEGKKQSLHVQDSLNEKENDITESHLVKKAHDPAHDEVLTDMDYFKSRVKKEWSDSGSDSESESDSESVKDASRKNSDSQDVPEMIAEANHDEQTADPVQSKVEMEGTLGNIDSEMNQLSAKDEKGQVLETGRLFVRNLPYTATEDDLRDLFQKFGDLTEVHLVLDRGTKRSKGFAYVLYALPEAAVRALDELDNSIFQGRLLHVMPAKQQNVSEKEEDITANQTSKSFKQQREERRKASEIGGDTRAWNSLFMRPDTVNENIARKLGVSKSDLLDLEATDLAVRIALGEADVVKDTKKALENSGVNVSALEEVATGNTDAIKRSNHIVLVKNLPYGSSEGDLAKMFGRFGSIDKIILPPTKSLALVVFLEASEARSAFKGLAYKRYKDGPLYLEWAPNNILSSSPKSDSDAQKGVIIGEQDAKRALLEQRIEGISDEDIDPDRPESRTLFVKNLNFKTSDEGLRKHFSENMKDGSIRSVKIKKHLKNEKNVSMGFGFIEFDSMETAVHVLNDLQGTILDGHALILQISNAKKEEQGLKKVEKDKNTPKLIVRNVAFEATEKDLRQLFSPFGQIKSLRLPKKFGNHRGFAFVEFITKQEAQNAFQALSSTHLYGRHLVIERAKADESLEELRERTAAQFTNAENGYQNPSKLSKKRKLTSD